MHLRLRSPPCPPTFDEACNKLDEDNESIHHPSTSTSTPMNQNTNPRYGNKKDTQYGVPFIQLFHSFPYTFGRMKGTYTVPNIPTNTTDYMSSYQFHCNFPISFPLLVRSLLLFPILQTFPVTLLLVTTYA